jgi:hypothetical protein
MLRCSLLPPSSDYSKCMMVTIYQSTRHHIPQHWNLQHHHWENHKYNAGEKTKFVWELVWTHFDDREEMLVKNVLKLQAKESSKCKKTKKKMKKHLQVEHTWAEDGGPLTDVIRILSVVLEIRTQTGRLDLSLYGYFSKVEINVGFQLISYQLL